MIDWIDSFPRHDPVAREDFRLDVPEEFNFARDVIGRRQGTALITVAADGTVAEVSHAELAARSDRLAAALAAKGLAKGARVLIVMGRVADWYVTLFACMKAGLVAMPGTPLLTAKDIGYRVGVSGAGAAIVSPEHCGKVEEARPDLPVKVVAGAARAGWDSLAALEAAAPGGWVAPVMRADDPMMIYFTSGTTAAPKMVPRDHGYALAHVVTGMFWMDLRPGDVHWTLTDTGWAKAAWGLLFGPLLMGAKVVLAEAPGAFDAATALRLIGRLGVTSFCAPPTIYRMFVQMDLAAFDLSSLRRCLGAGEPLNPEAMRIWKEATGLEIADGYGQTETVAVVGNMPGAVIRPGSMGRPLPGFDVDVVDDAGNRLPAGEPGHVAIRTSGTWPPGLFHGYLTAEGEDVRAFRNGWYHTGDVARRDAEGYFWFVGRSDDVILSAGYRISPFEVESTLLTHPAVMESAVVGAPDPVRGEVVRAYIVLAAGHEPSAALFHDIQDHCKREAAPYKYPREIRFVTSLPKTISGKIRRVELRQQAQAETRQ